MCGITGQVNQDKERPVDRHVLARMNEAIRHRGPDSGGFYVNGGVGLAARRLAVIDLKTGQQPVSNEDGSIRLVFNGEIYNYRRLRANLEKNGHRFQTGSDTETIVHLYEEHGKECVGLLRGMFAFALWDDSRQRLLLVRDRFGKKPLYYSTHDGAFLFGSEIKCLLEYPDFPRQIDLSAIDHYLSLQYVPDPLSAFVGIRKLPPAHRLIWERGRIEIERYWRLSYEPKLAMGATELQEELLARLEEAVRLRLVSDVPLGVHLSGGIDSSIVAAFTSRLTNRPVKTFSIGFEEQHFSELPYARAVARHYRTEHHEFLLRPGDLADMTGKLVRCFDEPFADPSAIPVYMLAQKTREHVTVALNGDGGDELFAGYVRYGLDGYADAYGLLPSAVTQTVVPAVLSMIPQALSRPGEKDIAAGLGKLAQAVCITRKANVLRWGSYFTDAMKTELWKQDIRRDLRRRNRPTVEWLSDIFDDEAASSLLDRTLSVDTRSYLPGDLLVKADRMTMAHSLEARSPFLDHELQAWAARLPEHLKLKGRIHKCLLKAACAPLLPEGIINRGKQGFGIPLGAWLQGPLKKSVREQLLDPQAKTHQYFERETMVRLFDEHTHREANHANRLWALLIFEVWLRNYI
jgi:asparagine synthase (glutamine-hydrolysing)